MAFFSSIRLSYHHTLNVALTTILLSLSFNKASAIQHPLRTVGTSKARFYTSLDNTAIQTNSRPSMPPLSTDEIMELMRKQNARAQQTAPRTKYKSMLGPHAKRAARRSAQRRRKLPYLRHIFNFGSASQPSKRIFLKENLNREAQRYLEQLSKVYHSS